VDGVSTVPMVKGYDRFLKDALDALGLKYKFVPVFLAPNYTRGKGGLRDRLVGRAGPEDPEIDDYEVYTGTWGSIGSTFGRQDRTDEDCGGTKEFLKSVLCAKSIGRVRWIVPPKEMQLTLYATNYGNEPISTEYYAVAAFLAQAPPSSDVSHD
jgi:hypothetical protein